LTWTQDETCLPVSRFDIYQDGVFVKSVAGTVFTTEVDINNANNSTYNFFIIAGTSGNVVSNPSNSVSISISIVVYPPTNLINGTPKLTSITSITEGLASVQISWSPSLLNLCGITGYNIYQNNILVATVPPSVTSYTTTLPTNAIYNFNVTSVLGEIESVFSSTLNVNLPEIYTTTGSPADTFLAGSITLKYSVAGAFDFNYELSMEYTLVGGGSGGGYWYDIVGTAAGGGGQVLNTNGSRNVSANNWAIVVGTGGVGATTGADGGTGTDSSILGTGFSVATNNNSYAGQGGQGAVNFSYAGGGGSGNPTSANGGIYNTTNRNGTGGGGGSLTLVDLTNTIITLDTIGGPGQDSPSTTGGNGGNGQPGIDLITYGGGGGGGGWPGPIPYSPDFDGNPGGIGGAGGGGTGATNVTIPLSRDGTAPGGGGGGGLNTSNTFPGFGIDPGSGSNGIVILLFTAPP
jgi:hypothetical protein